jgi:hypothetical protein
MRNRWRQRVGASLIGSGVLASMLVLPARAGQAVLPTHKFGTQVGSWGLTQDALDTKLRPLGAQSVRINFDCDERGSSPDQSITELIATYRPIIDRAHAAGLEITGLFSNDLRCGWGLVNWNESTANHPHLRTFVSHAKQVMQAFNGKVAAWEVWNEPNAAPTFLSPTNMAFLMAHTFGEARHNGISGKILFGGIHATDSGGSADHGGPYLSSVYTAGRALAGADAAENWNTVRATRGQYPLDGVAYHPYMRNAHDRNGIPPLATALASYLNGFVAAIDAAEGHSRQLKLWLTEYGWIASDAAKAESTRQTFGLLRDHGRVYQVHQFTLQGDGFGLYTSNWTPEPQYIAAYKQFTGGVTEPEPGPNPPTAPAPAWSWNAGLTGEYFDGPNFTTPRMIRQDSAVNFTWGTGGPGGGIDGDTFSVRWNGFLVPPTAGAYQLCLLGDDGYRLHFNGGTIINRWIVQGPTEICASAGTLQANQTYRIGIDYFEEGSGASISLRWRRPGSGVNETVPGSAFRPAGLAASYWNNRYQSGNPVVGNWVDSNLNMNYGTGTVPDPSGRVPADNFSARWSGLIRTYTGGSHQLCTYADDGVRLRVNGQLVIDDWTEHALSRRCATVTLNSGVFYPIQVDYFDSAGEARIHLSWIAPGRAEEIIPPIALRPYAGV